QEPMTSLNPLHTIEKQVAEAIGIHNPGTADSIRRQARELLEAVGLESVLERGSPYPHELSGGQRQRVMIAMALANKPDLLIADEPTTAVDVTIQAQLLELLASLRARYGMAMLFITHDLSVVRKIADRVCVMNAGRIVETGPTSEVLHTPEHPYTRHLLAAEPSGEPDPTQIRSPEVLGVRNLKVWYPIRTGLLRRTTDHVKAVDGVTLDVREGETLGVVGESGSGKSTLGLAILGLVASQGERRFLDHDLASSTAEETRTFRRQAQIVFQDPYGSLSPRLSVGEIVGEGLLVHPAGIDETGRRARIAAALQEVDLPADAADRYPHEFSGGQRQRIAIARAMILRPRLIILDEPTSALDVSVQAQITELLKNLQRQHGTSYVFISHDLRVVRSLAHRVAVMKAGHVVEQAPTGDLFASPQQAYTQELIRASLL
ncbi:MAG TPA: microcin ABC transporter ATP-binding protein, partial [Deltaproteobacteria bacterium]|nr:microcin ABC transporter ATP-binding protein [Deltaproteobacteria bacterium]